MLSQNVGRCEMGRREVFDGICRVIAKSTMCKGGGGGAGVVVKALRYKPAGRGFDSRWCHWNLSVT
jgi:hypothetical protein